MTLGRLVVGTGITGWKRQGENGATYPLKMLLPAYRNTLCHIPKDCKFHIQCSRTSDDTFLKVMFEQAYRRSSL